MQRIPPVVDVAMASLSSFLEVASPLLTHVTVSCQLDRSVARIMCGALKNQNCLNRRFRQPVVDSDHILNSQMAANACTLSEVSLCGQAESVD